MTDNLRNNRSQLERGKSVEMGRRKQKDNPGLIRTEILATQQGWDRCPLFAGLEARKVLTDGYIIPLSIREARQITDLLQRPTDVTK